MLGYAVRRSGRLLRGYLGKAAAVAVMVAGLLSINSGLILGGSSVSPRSAWKGLTGVDARAEAPSPGGDGAVTVDANGVQHIVIDVQNASYVPRLVQAKAGLPARLTLETNGIRGCTRGFVVPKANFEASLPVTGETVIDLGELAAGRLDYTCAMGMYRGAILAS